MTQVTQKMLDAGSIAWANNSGNWPEFIAKMYLAMDAVKPKEEEFDTSRELLVADALYEHIVEYTPGDVDFDLTVAYLWIDLTEQLLEAGWLAEDLQDSVERLAE